MTRKIFISYSHKDETFRQDFGEHLAMMQRNKTIDCWHDRKILPGEDWKNTIDENLEAADIVIFLVSSSFLASEYCYDVEVKRAMERYDEGTAQIISIIVRDCDWKECPFSRFQVVPKEALPISKWPDKDTAWLDAINGIKKHIADFKPIEIFPALTKNAKDESVFLSEKLKSWLEDTEITLTHRKVSRIKLSDIYVVPDMEIEGDEKSNIFNIKSSAEILKSPGHYIISSEEQQGKTSLLKYIYIELLKLQFIPVYLDATKIKKSNVESSVEKAIEEQYIDLTLPQFLKLPRRVLLLDDIDQIGLNKKFRNVFLEKINGVFDYSVLTCHDSFSYIYGEIPALDEYIRSDLLGLGNKKREEIVKKWISLGVEESIEDVELYAQCDELKIRLNTVIKKNIVPPRPIYVLMLLQMFEANAQLNLELTSYGHCYQQLIYQSFDRAKIQKNEVEKYLNVLTELAWWIFIHGLEPNESQMEEFFDTYCDAYLTVDRDLVISKLTKYAILTTQDFKTGFKYPYIYYFFVGKKMAESYSDSDEVKIQVEKLLSQLHREDYANILIFITHHTKDSWVLTEIKQVLSALFDDQREATLDKRQLSFMDEFMKKIPELIIEQREIQQERDAYNERLDEIERTEEDDKDLGMLDESQDILANINKTFKGMEIAGQIIRNRHASLTRDALSQLAESGASTGLRFLEFFIKISDAAKKEIINLISTHLAEHPNLTDQEIEKYAEDAYVHLTYGVINSVIRKIASSIGSKEALEIYSLLDEKSGTPAYTLIKQAIELQFNKKLKIESVKSCAEKLHSNPVCMRILKEMIVQHIYMFPVEYKEKQQLSSLLGISVQGQYLMDQQKAVKG